MSDNNNYQSNIRKSAIWFTALPFLTQLARFANSILLARILSPEEFGIIGIVMIIMYYADTFTEFGFGKAIVQRKVARKEHYQSFFTFNLSISSVIFISLILFSEEIARYFEMPPLSEALDVFAVYVLITAFIVPIRVKLDRAIKYKRIAIIEAIKILSQIPISLILAHNGFGFWSIIYAMLVGQTLSLAIYVGLNKGLILPTYKIFYLRSLFKFSKWDFVAGQAHLLADNVGKLFIGKMLGAGALGLYDRAHGLAVMPYMQISRRLSTVSFSSFSRLQSSKEELAYYFERLTSMQAALLFPAMVGLASVADVLVASLLGEKWMGAVKTLEIISIGFLVGSVSNSFNALNMATGNIAIQTKLDILAVGLFIVSLAFFTEYGLEAVALCFVAYQLLRLVFEVAIASRRTSLSVTKALMSFLPYLIASATMYAGVRILYAMEVFNEDWQNFLFLCIAGAIIYTTLVITMPFKSSLFLRNKASNLFAKFRLRSSN